MLLDPLSVSISSSQVPSKPPRPQRKLLQPSPDHPDDYILEIDYSSLSDFMCCQRKAENKLVHSREANGDQSATSFGGLFHRLEERRLSSGGLSIEVVQKQNEDIAFHFLENPTTDYRNEARMRDVISFYNSRYATDDWPQKVLQVSGEPFVERAFKIELCTIPVNQHNFHYSEKDVIVGREGRPETFYIRNIHVLYTGKIDAMLQEGAFLFNIDHKTSSRGGREFEEAFRLSLQTRMYCWAAEKLLQRPVAGLILNAVIIRPLTKTGTGTEFNRITYFYRPDQLEEAVESTKAIISDFISSLLRGYFPQQARSFISPCAHCDYSENCTLPPEQRAADLASDLYRNSTWNPMHQ